jgi:hypothetical protein
MAQREPNIPSLHAGSSCICCINFAKANTVVAIVHWVVLQAFTQATNQLLAFKLKPGLQFPAAAAAAAAAALAKFLLADGSTVTPQKRPPFLALVTIIVATIANPSLQLGPVWPPCEM